MKIKIDLSKCKCKICNTVFSTYYGITSHVNKMHNMTTKEYYDAYIKNKQDGICKICGNITTYVDFNRGYRSYCSAKCSRKDPAVYLKGQATNLQKYGSKCSLQNDNIKNKARETKEKVYGDKYYCNSEKSKKTYEMKTFNKYKNNLSNIELLDYKDKTFICRCLVCNKDFQASYEIVTGRSDRKIPICILCNPIEKAYSAREKELLEYVRTIYGGQIIENDRVQLKPYEIDIYLPELKIGIEFNGDYWHSLPEVQENDKNKRELALKQNIQIITVKELDWLNDKDEIMNMIQTNILCKNKG